MSIYEEAEKAGSASGEKKKNKASDERKRREKIVRRRNQQTSLLLKSIKNEKSKVPPRWRRRLLVSTGYCEESKLATKFFVRKARNKTEILRIGISLPFDFKRPRRGRYNIAILVASENEGYFQIATSRSNRGHHGEGATSYMAFHKDEYTHEGAIEFVRQLFSEKISRFAEESEGRSENPSRILFFILILLSMLAGAYFYVN